MAGDSTEIRSTTGLRHFGSAASCGHNPRHGRTVALAIGRGSSPTIAVVSVGTSNTDGHPRRDVIQAMSARGIKVLCTQITRQCSDDLEFLRRVFCSRLLIQVVHCPGKIRRRQENSRNVACAGTVPR